MLIPGKTEKVRIDSTGRVGIGKTPAYLLDVYSASLPEFRIGDGTISLHAYAYTGQSSAVVGTVGAHALIFRTNSLERMQIDNAGKVGIGKAPAYPLDVSGDVQATTFRGVATSAQYADLAERYESDAFYSVGTLVKIGGFKEITMVNEELDEDVLGVVSANPAYLMNSGLAGTKVTVALQGRCPVKVTGRIEKGDMLVSAGDGRARASDDPQLGQVIGKALEDFSGTEGIIEVAIGRT